MKNPAKKHASSRPTSQLKWYQTKNAIIIHDHISDPKRQWARPVMLKVLYVLSWKSSPQWPLKTPAFDESRWPCHRGHLIYQKVNKQSSQCQQELFFSVWAVNNMSKIIISLKFCSCYFTARRLAAAKVFGHEFIRQNFERLRWTLTKSVTTPLIKRKHAV